MAFSTGPIPLREVRSEHHVSSVGIIPRVWDSGAFLACEGVCLNLTFMQGGLKNTTTAYPHE